MKDASASFLAAPKHGDFVGHYAPSRVTLTYDMWAKVEYGRGLVEFG